MSNKAREIAQRQARRQLPSAAYPSSTDPQGSSRFGHVAAFNSVTRRDEHVAQLRREVAAFEAEARRRKR